MLGDILESVGIPLIPLGSIDALNNSFCYVVTGFCHIFLRNNALDTRSFLMEAGPGSLIPSFGPLHHSNNLIEVEVLGECKIRPLKPQTLLSISKSRALFFGDFTESLSHLHMASMSFQQMLSSKPETRMATTIFNYANTPFWHSGSEIISLPPLPILARILNLTESELIRQVNTLIDHEAIQTPKHSASDCRLNLVIKSEHILVQIMGNHDRTFSNVMTIGNNLDTFVSKLMQLFTIRRTHFNNAEDAIQSIKLSPDRFDLIIAGNCTNTSAYTIFSNEITKESLEIRRILPRLIIETTEITGNVFNKFSGRKNCVPSFNDNFSDAVEIVFRCLSLSTAKTKTNATNVIPLSIYQIDTGNRNSRSS